MGFSGSSRKSALVISRSSPGMFSVIGRAPVAMWKCFARSVVPLTSTVSGLVKCTSPCSVEMPAFFSPASILEGMAPVKVCLNAIISGQLIDV